MNIKSKALIIITVIGAGIFGYNQITPEPVEEYTGYVTNKYGLEFKDMNIHLVNRKTEILYDTLNNDQSGTVIKFVNGLEKLVTSTRTSEQIISRKPVVQYKFGKSDGFTIEPKGLAVGLQYSGHSNLDRTAFDEVSFGFLSTWFKSSDPKIISNKVFGDVVSDSIGFPLAILYFQRQLLEQTALAEFKSKAKYQPIFADYSFLYGEYILEDKPFKKDALENINTKIASNITNITNFLYEQDKAKNPEVNNMAMFLLEFYISEDMKLFKTLERDLKMITPLDNSFKQEKRQQRMEAESRMRKLEDQEREKARRKSPSIRMGN